MFASLNYFKPFNCPFFENGLCERPNCMFRHVRKDDNLHQTAKEIPVTAGKDKNHIHQLVFDAVDNIIKSSEGSESSIATVLKNLTKKFSQNTQLTENNNGSEASSGSQASTSTKTSNLSASPTKTTISSSSTETTNASTTVESASAAIVSSCTNKDTSNATNVPTETQASSVPYLPAQVPPSYVPTPLNMLEKRNPNESVSRNVSKIRVRQNLYSSGERQPENKDLNVRIKSEPTESVQASDFDMIESIIAESAKKHEGKMSNNSNERPKHKQKRPQTMDRVVRGVEHYRKNVVNALNEVKSIGYPKISNDMIVKREPESPPKVISTYSPLYDNLLPGPSSIPCNSIVDTPNDPEPVVSECSTENSEEGTLRICDEEAVQVERQVTPDEVHVIQEKRTVVTGFSSRESVVNDALKQRQVALVEPQEHGERKERGRRGHKRSKHKKYSRKKHKRRRRYKRSSSSSSSTESSDDYDSEDDSEDSSEYERYLRWKWKEKNKLRRARRKRYSSTEDSSSSRTSSETSDDEPRRHQKKRKEDNHRRKKERYRRKLKHRIEETESDSSKTNDLVKSDDEVSSEETEHISKRSRKERDERDRKRHNRSNSSNSSRQRSHERKKEGKSRSKEVSLRTCEDKPGYEKTHRSRSIEKPSKSKSVEAPRKPERGATRSESRDADKMKRSKETKKDTRPCSTKSGKQIDEGQSNRRIQNLSGSDMRDELKAAEKRKISEDKHSKFRDNESRQRASDSQSRIRSEEKRVIHIKEEPMTQNVGATNKQITSRPLQLNTPSWFEAALIQADSAAKVSEHTTTEHKQNSSNAVSQSSRHKSGKEHYSHKNSKEKHQASSSKHHSHRSEEKLKRHSHHSEKERRKDYSHHSDRSYGSEKERLKKSRSSKTPDKHSSKDRRHSSSNRERKKSIDSSSKCDQSKKRRNGSEEIFRRRKGSEVSMEHDHSKKRRRDTTEGTDAFDIDDSDGSVGLSPGFGSGAATPVMGSSDEDTRAEAMNVHNTLVDDLDLGSDFEEETACSREREGKKPPSAKEIQQKYFDKVSAGCYDPRPKKQRVAHQPGLSKKLEYVPKPVRVPVGQMVHDRYRKLQQATGNAESAAASKGKNRISHCGNVSKIINAKEQLKHRVESMQSTVAQTVPKGKEREAHRPSEKLLKRPTIPLEYGSKIPSAIRQRCLNLLIDVTIELFSSQKAAFERGLEEEKLACERSTTKAIYLNKVSNTISRMKKESGLMTMTGTSSSGQGNRVVSHFDVLVGKPGTKGTWSIERAKRPNTEQSISGAALYRFMSLHLLTDDQLDTHGFPRPDPLRTGKAVFLGSQEQYLKNRSSRADDRVCMRCNTRYAVDAEGFPLAAAQCVYHWGRIYKRRGLRGSGPESKYGCCGGDPNTEGCSVGQYHVCDNWDPDNQTGYVQTTLKEDQFEDEENYGTYALDCEMCYTTEGSELTRITVIGQDLKAVYETLVKPYNPILDYNTRFSGITEEMMEGVTTRLGDVQAVLLNRFSSKTILVGHSLESDFKALKLIHESVVDTSVVFPHKMGLPFKRALRTLSAELLNKIIQNDVGGHDSAEDARICMELMMFKAKEDMKRMAH